VVKAATLVERPDEGCWGYKRRDRRVAVIGDRIILSSLCHPSHNITFTINLWAHFVTMLKDGNNASRLRTLKRKAYGRREVLFRRHLGKGYYVTTLYRKHILEFRQHCVWHGEEICMIYASKNGISINLQDEWDDFLNNVFRVYTITTRSLPMHSHNEDVNMTTKAVIWDGRLYNNVICLDTTAIWRILTNVLISA